jgi:hypothetical protein
MFILANVQKLNGDRCKYIPALHSHISFSQKCHIFVRTCDYCLFLFPAAIPPTNSVNLALGQPTWQSTTLEAFTSDEAVDGNKDPNFGQGSCSHTALNDPSPSWLAVDLGKPTDVYGAAVTNRGDCCESKLASRLCLVVNLEVMQAGYSASYNAQCPLD